MQQKNKPNGVTRDYNIAWSLPRTAEGFLFDVGSLYERLERLTDSRHAKGKVYPLVEVLVLVVLAKLAGQNGLRGIVQWVHERGAWLTAALDLPMRWDKQGAVRMPCASTYSRMLGKTVQPTELETCVREYLSASRPEPEPGRTYVQLNLDGKKIRGTLSPAHPEGVYLLGVFLAEQGLMLIQLAIPQGHGELTEAPQVLSLLDLQGKVISGDAEFTQRELSAQIVSGGGDYVWKVKKNQPTLLEDILDVFQAPTDARVPGFSSPAQGHDFRWAEDWAAAHGRSEHRMLTVSSELNGFTDWPGLAQVFTYECTSQDKRTHHTTYKLICGITSLTAQEASPQDLLHLVRQHWSIESDAHYRRDVKLHEDNSHLEVGHLPQVMAGLNNLVIGLTIGRGARYLPDVQRHFDAHPDQALKLVLFC